MRIHALQTGTVRVKDAFMHPRAGLARQPALFLPGEFGAPLPIHCWAVEHDGRVLLVDTGETAAGRDVPFARFDVGPDDELPAVLAAAGLSPAGIDAVVLTHMHGDHMDGTVYVAGRPAQVTAAELAYSRHPFSRLMSKVLRQPLPAGVTFAPAAHADGPFGAFPASRRLSEDGRILAVPTPGHTPGHQSIVCVDDDGRHVFLAGDTTDTLEQLLELRADAIAPSVAVHVRTLERIVAHGAAHPTVYLPSHDPESAARLAAGTVL